MLSRLFETLARAEKLLEAGQEEGLSKLVSRVASEYTQVVYLLEKARAEACSVVDTLSSRVDNIRTRLSVELSKLLLDALEEDGDLRQVLRIYELIEGWEEAEEIVREHFLSFCKEVSGIANELMQTIVSSALTTTLTPSVPITPGITRPVNPFERLSESTTLALVYNRILTKVGLYQPLMSISEELSGRFNFFAGVLWPEIATRITEELGSVIFSAGRPDELHKVSDTNV